MRLVTRPLIILVVALAMLAVAQPAAAKDYRPWKAAMVGWWHDYEDRWGLEFFAARDAGTYSEDLAVIGFPPGAFKREFIERLAARDRKES